ncbi:MAG: hypothetical protein ACTSV2_10360 [Candidatus Thorarchaeota archaeon]
MGGEEYYEKLSEEVERLRGRIDVLSRNVMILGIFFFLVSMGILVSGLTGLDLVGINAVIIFLFTMVCL